MWQNNIFSYIFFFRWESLLVENRLKIIVIVREQGGGGRGFYNHHSPLERGQYVLCLPLLLLEFCQCSSFCPWVFADFVKVKEIAVLYIKHTCTRTINLQFFLSAPVAQVVECPLRGTGGHGFDSGPRHTKLVKNSTSCSSLGTGYWSTQFRIMWLGVVSCQVSGAWYFSEAAL